MADVSVIICSHNPMPSQLGRVLAALETQTLPRCDWELLLVDNASAEPLAARWPLPWHPRARHVRENRLGLTPARLRGIRDASGDLLVYVDDDNVLAPDYLRNARDLVATHPHLGAIGAGVLAPEFAVEPPRELVPHLGLLALREASGPLWSNNPRDLGCVPWGAGLCVSRQVAQEYERLVAQLGMDEVLDRHGEHLFGAGDVAFSWSAVLGGQGFGVFPTLCVTHLIRAERLTRRYFLQLVHDRSFSAGVLNFLRTGTPPGDGYGAAERVLRLALRGIRKGPFAMRMGWAATRGADRARAFIAAQHLRQVLPRPAPAVS
jgi:glycosyltransferase involved in cell wall biosynthesis